MTTEELDMEALNWTNKYFGPEEDRRDDMEIRLSDVDAAFVAGAKWETSRHNSKAENLAQSLLAIRNFCFTQIIHTPQLLNTLALVDQCLLENKPENLLL